MEKLELIKKWIKGNVVSVISIIITIITLIGSFTYIYFNRCTECKLETVIENTVGECHEIYSEESIKIKTYRIDVKGSVNSPGVYEISENSTVEDAINLAGGITEEGITSNINLSKRIKDEMVIYVFSKSEMDAKKSNNEIVCEIPKCEVEEVTVYKEVCTNPVVAINEINSDITKEENSKEESNEKVSINTDSIEELMRLDGIGESKAKQIIEYRRENGNFKSIEDIKNVSGIGDKAFEKIKNKITI